MFEHRGRGLRAFEETEDLWMCAQAHNPDRRKPTSREKLLSGRKISENRRYRVSEHITDLDLRTLSAERLSAKYGIKRTSIYHIRACRIRKEDRVK
jgi:hypothetical protein